MQQVVFSTEEDAENVRNELLKLQDLYGYVSVNDFLELSGAPHRYSYEEESKGWAELGDIQIGRTKDAGYVLELPEPQSLREATSAFPFLKGWWVIVDIPDDQTYEGELVDEIGGNMIIRTKPSDIQLGIPMDKISKIDFYRERPASE